MLLVALFSAILKFNIVVSYNDAAYTGESTLYYTKGQGEFKEENSIYTYAKRGKAVFEYKNAYKRIFIVPNREKGKTAEVKSVSLALGFVPVYTVSGNKMNRIVYSNKDEDTITYANGVLSVTSTEANPYPRLVFADELSNKLNKLSKVFVFVYILLAAVCVAFAFGVRWLLIKKPRFTGFLKAKHGNIIFHLVFACLMLLAIRGINSYCVSIDYDTNLDGNESIIYFDYDNRGFKEINSTYTKVLSPVGQNPFFVVSDLEGLRFVPNRVPDTKAKIEGIKLWHEGTLVKNYSADELKSKYLQNSNEVALENGCIVVETTSTMQQYPIVSFNQRFLDELNRSTTFILLIDLLKVFGFFAFLQLCNYFYKKGRLHQKKYISKIKGQGKTVGALSFVLTAGCALSGISAVAYTVIPLVLMVCIYTLGTGNKLSAGKRMLYTPACAIVAPILLFNINSGLFLKQNYFAFVLWCCALLVLSALCYVCTMQIFAKNYSENKITHIENIAGFLIKIIVVVCIYECIKIALQYEYYSPLYILELLLGDVLQLNIMLLFAMLCAVYGLLGRAWTNIVAFAMFFVIILGNFIKLKYHNTMLVPTDFMQIKDAFAIAPDIIGTIPFYIIIFSGVALIIAAIVNIKRIVVLLKPKLFVSCFMVSAVLLCVLGRGVIKGAYAGINVCDKPYIDEVTNERTNGVAIYNMFKIMHIPDTIIKAPDDYSEKTVQQLNQQFKALNTGKNDGIKPNVICVLAESYVDLNSIEGLELNADTIPYTREHGFVTMISPHYGGYTAAVEYEVLTGLTLAFYPPAVIPYTSYYNKSEKVIPSVPQTFADNGYKTYAIHPNTANFYSRDKAYEMMGIQEYWAIDQFDGAEQVNNKFVKDDEVANKVIQTIEDNNEPVFTFAITMESHATSDQRFDEPRFEASGEMSEDELLAVEEQATAYSDTDTMLKNLIEYIDASDEPTLLYVFGDHMPPLSAFGKLSYVNDLNNKYATVAMCHSNYKEIALTDHSTPNYIGAQMVVDSGVEHSPYFDFIMDMQKRIPILHREFTEINTEQNKDLKKYYMIQYDLMFGKQWFYNK